MDAGDCRDDKRDGFNDIVDLHTWMDTIVVMGADGQDRRGKALLCSSR